MQTTITMHSYSDKGHDTGVTAYSLFNAGLIVQFKRGDYYLYDIERPGTTHLKNMKVLARKGTGLSTYISQNVHNSYKGKWTTQEFGKLFNVVTK